MKAAAAAFLLGQVLQIEKGRQADTQQLLYTHKMLVCLISAMPGPSTFEPPFVLYRSKIF